VRETFVNTLADLAARDRRIVLLTGDLGYGVIDSFRRQHPDRFFNVGVAEQNMIGIASGLAEAGYLPFVYSITTFASLRPYEFIRNGPVVHRWPVRIAAIGAGFDYGLNGITHFALEDLALMRVQPGMTVIAPADSAQCRTALLATWDEPGPIYYRVGKHDGHSMPGLKGRFRVGRVEIVREGADVAFVVTGAIAREAGQAARKLCARGIRATVAVVACLSPAPAEDLAGILARHPLVITVEAHRVVGGLGSLVSEIAAERGCRGRVIRCGVRDGGPPAGTTAFLNRAHGLSSAAFVRTALRALGVV
jgi:transketolase